jgi:gliding-associated putative ABC transporter substrate-binding component GldG
MSSENENENQKPNQDNTENIEQDERLAKRQKKTESKRQQAIVRTALVLGILVLINIISINLFFRLDFTSNKIYTLSNASKSIVGKLDDKLVVKAYFTDNLPSPYNNTRRYLKEILDDYRNYSNGKLQYEIISPSDETQLETDAQKYGIQPVQVQTFKDDRAEAMKAYMGIVFLYGGKQEVLPFVGNSQNLEYDVTGVIKRLSEKEQKKVGFLSGPGVPGVDKFGKVNQFLQRYYQLAPVDASKNNPIPSDIAALIVMTPKAPPPSQFQQQQSPAPMIPENIKFAVDQYIMNGGKVIFLMNKVNVQAQQQFQFAQASGTGLEDMLESYGIKVLNDIVKDKECAYVSVPVQQGGMQFYTQIPFPYYPRIININKDLPAFSGLGQVFLAFTSSLDTSAAMSKGVKVTPLLITSPKSSADKEIAIIQTSGKMLPDSMFKSSNLLVGSIFNGVFNSFYNGKPVPSDTAAGSSPVPTAIKDKSPDSRIIVIGNGDFATDDFRGPDENLIFFSNLIDYMTDDVGLSEIRLKDANPKPIKSIEDSTRKILKYGLLVLPPILVLLYGMWRWRRRKTVKA